MTTDFSIRDSADKTAEGRFPVTLSSRLLLLVACAAFLFVRTPAGSSQSIVTEAHFERIAAAVQEKMKEYGVPGVAVGISHNGTRLSRGFGVTSVENPLPVTESTLFQAGSITKTFTATTVRDITRAIAKEYLGVRISDPTPITVSGSELMQYAARYSRTLMDVVVRVEADQVMIQRIQKQGFPTGDSPVPPPAPPAPYAFYAKDRLIGLGPAQGDRVEFLRRSDGTAGWIRVGGRVAPRVAVPPP